MKSKSKLYLVLVAVMSLLLAACGGGEQKFTENQLNQATKTAADNARAEEAKLIDGKWTQARTRLQQLGADTAATGKFVLVNNCNVKPDGFSQMQETKNFPSSAFDEFKAGCVSKVYAMKAERKAEANRAVAQAKQAERKLAAAKQKAEEAKRLAAAKAKAKQHPKS